MRQQGYVHNPLGWVDPLGTDPKAEAGPANFMKPQDQFRLNAAQRSDVDPTGYSDVVAHGSPDSIEVQTANGPMEIDHRAAASLIEQQPDYNGLDIRLLSCSTGLCDAGFAQNLANKMNVNVFAPNDILWAYSNGSMTVAPPINGVLANAQILQISVDSEYSHLEVSHDIANQREATGAIPNVRQPYLFPPGRPDFDSSLHTM